MYGEINERLGNTGTLTKMIFRPRYWGTKREPQGIEIEIVRKITRTNLFDGCKTCVWSMSNLD